SRRRAGDRRSRAACRDAACDRRKLLRDRRTAGHRGGRAARSQRHPRADAVRGHLFLAHRLHLRLWARLLGRPRRGRHLDRLLALAHHLRDAIDLALPRVDGRRGGRRRTPYRTRQGAVTEAYLRLSSALHCQDPMVEHLQIARLGQRGDGIAETPVGPVYVSYTLPGETAAVDAWPGHPDRRHLISIEVASPDRIAPICPHFGARGRVRPPPWSAVHYREWKR